MHLRTIRVDRFRGIRHVDVGLHRLTVLVGENAWGRTSLLGALERVLGSRDGHIAEFTLDDVHHDRQLGSDGAAPGRIRIELDFQERRGGEWDAPEHEPLRPVMGTTRARRRRIVLRLEGDRTGDELATTCSFRAPDLSPLEIDPPAERLATIRRLCPLVVIARDRLVPADDVSELDELAAASPDDPAAFVRAFASQLVAQRGRIGPMEVEHCVQCIRRLSDERADVEGGGMFDHILRLLESDRRGLSEAISGGSTGARTATILALVGAILQGGGATALERPSRPLIVIDQPESHLHPIRLATLWSIIESMRAQRIVTTNAPEVLARPPLRAIRRLVRTDSGTSVLRLKRRTLTTDERRRVGYHVRTLRGGALFARCWLLVEGETEFWILPEVARLMGYRLDAEGIRPMEFAQAGIEPLVKLANDLGIHWHLLADGDRAGETYGRTVERLVPPGTEDDHRTLLTAPNIEAYFWAEGFDGVIAKAAGTDAERARRRIRSRGDDRGRRERERVPGWVIDRAVRARSKPGLALLLLDELRIRVEERGLEAIPDQLRRVVDRCVEAARGDGLATRLPLDGNSVT